VVFAGSNDALHKMRPFDPAEVESIEADVVQATYDF
jgi:hypothetical protein